MVSYTEDKKSISLCLENKGNLSTKLYMNTLEHVLLHELAHIMSNEYGHTPIFWKNFKILLQEAVDMNLHQSIDYAKHNINYCGNIIKYNPYYDISIST